jgi:anti-sigma B factor antagonist
MPEQDVLLIHPHDEVVHAEVQCTELDEDGTRQMQNALFKAAEKLRSLPVLLDLSRLTFLPSLSIGALVSCLTEFKKVGQPFILVGLQRPVRDTLAMTRLDRVFEIYDSIDEALDQVRRSRQ